MSLDGNGTYLPPAPQFPAIPNTIIYAGDFNQIILDIATALSTAIFRDGQAAFTADQSMGSHKLTNLANGINPQDATTVLQVFTDPVFLATTVAGFKITGSMFQALMTTISLVASGTVTLTGTTLLDMSASGQVKLPANTSIGPISASELATLDGITATTAELNKLHGATLSTAELNILTGAVVTVTELNRLQGVTSGVQVQFDNITGSLLPNKASLNSPAFTGVPTAPTAAPGTNTNQIATMAALVAQAFNSNLPSQTSNADKLVTTDGTTASWSALLKASVIRFKDQTDATKLLAFDCSGISTGTTRTLTVPNSSGTIALLSDIPTAGLTLLATLTPTAAAAVDALSVFSSTYDNYLIIGDLLTAASYTSAPSLNLQFANGGTVDTASNYIDMLANSGSGASVTTTSSVVTTASNATARHNFSLTILNANDTTNPKAASSISIVDANPGSYVTYHRGLGYTKAAAISGVRLLWSNGANFVAQGKIRIYGFKN